MIYSHQSFFRASNMYFLTALIMIAATVIYGVFQFQIMTSMEAASLDNARTVKMLSDSLQKEKTSFKTFSDERAKRQKEFREKISDVLPQDENYTDLTRLFDDYFANNDKQGNPMLQNSLRFGKGAPVESMPSVSALPISMNVEATRENFFKFLDFIKKSGSLESGIRLMEVKSINFSFLDAAEDTKDPKQKMNFSVEMIAYYQTTND